MESLRTTLMKNPELKFKSMIVGFFNYTDNNPTLSKSVPLSVFISVGTSLSTPHALSTKIFRKFEISIKKKSRCHSRDEVIRQTNEKISRRGSFDARAHKESGKESDA